MDYEIGVVKNGEAGFPKRLRRIKPAVDKIFYKGNFEEDLFKNCLAVVGTRRITEYGRQVTERLVRGAASAGITIVSGFMFGVDAVAHKVALDAGGRTIAVMPCGIEKIIPSYQEELYFEILESGGCVMSEIGGNFEAKPWTFVQRNRIVAALSQAVLVIEGDEGSGTLITARFARKYGRAVLAVPGPITSRMSKAPNGLIKEGAKPVTCVEDILSVFQLGEVRLPQVRKGKGKEVGKEIAGLENEILDVLGREPKSADEIIKNVSADFKEVNALLIKMEIAGRIKEKLGKYYLC